MEIVKKAEEKFDIFQVQIMLKLLSVILGTFLETHIGVEIAIFLF